MFAELLVDYTHWGFIDLDIVPGDLSPMLEDLKHYDVVTYPDGVRPAQCMCLDFSNSLLIAVHEHRDACWPADRVPQCGAFPQVLCCVVQNAQRRHSGAGT